MGFEKIEGFSTCSLVLTLREPEKHSNTMTITYREYTSQYGLDFKEYQEECVNWCIEKEKKNHGGLIADEMGLGKTYQCIALMCCRQVKNTLVICPVSLISQWETAVKTHSNLNVFVYRGKERNSITRETLKNDCVVIASYHELKRVKRHEREWASLLQTIEWQRVIFDEAHHLRNKKTVIHQSAYYVKSHIKWLLTGTPIQNSRKDFYSLCDVIGIPSHIYQNTGNLCKYANEYFIKRTKRGLGINMPDLHKNVVKVEWENEDDMNMSNILHSRLGWGTTPDRLPQFGCVLVDYLRTKQLCTYPKLLDSVFNKKTRWEDEEGKDIDKEVIDSVKRATECKGKLGKVLNLILERRDTGKKLVFCEFRQQMEFLEGALLKNGMMAAVVNGSTTKEERNACLASESIDVLILQINTCGEGLNLQRYNEVYIVTPHWNPCVEEQAIGRCYRLGQTRPVTVYRFVMEHEQYGLERTIDTYIAETQQKKCQDIDEVNEAISSNT